MSSAFVPVNLLPGWLQAATAWNPVRYGIDATRDIMLSGWDAGTLVAPFAALLVFALATMTIGALMVRRATDSRPRS